MELKLKVLVDHVDGGGLAVDGELICFVLIPVDFGV